MESTLKLIFIIVIVVLSAWASYLQFFEIPKLVGEIKAWEEAEPTVVEKFLPGRVDTFVVIKGEETRQAPVDSTVATVEDSTGINSYKSYFGDNYLSGIVNSRVDGILESIEIEYYFKRDIESTSQTNLLQTTITRNVVKYKKVPSSGLSVGMFAGATPEHTYFGPSIGFQNKKGNNLSYSYDVLNKGHYVTFRRKISFPKLSLF